MPAGVATALAQLWPVLINQGPIVLLLVTAIWGFHRGWWIMGRNHREIVAGCVDRLAEKDQQVADAQATAEHFRQIAEANEVIAARALGRG